MGRYGEAEISLGKAVNKMQAGDDEAQDPRPFEELAELHLLQHEWEKLEETAGLGQEMADGNSHRLWFIMGLMENEREHYEKAAACFSKAIMIDFKEADYYLARAQSYLKAGDHAMALSDLDQVLGENPSHYMALSMKGTVLLEQGKPEAANRCLRKAGMIERGFSLTQQERKELSKQARVSKRRTPSHETGRDHGEER